jgi:MFS family permease
MKQNQAFNRVCGMIRTGTHSVASKLGLAGLPSQIHLMLLVNLLFSIGRNLAFPYLAMYMTGVRTAGGLEMDASLVGFMFMTGGFAYILALLVTGNLCDRFGRRKMILMFVVSQVLLTAAYAYATLFPQFFVVYIAMSIAGAFSDPAYSAMVADLVEPSRREEVYGLGYMIANIAVVFSPPIGGVIASVNGYPILFIYATVFAAVGAGIALVFIRESCPERGRARSVTLSQFAGVFRDKLFILFCSLGALTNVVYSQLYGLLSVYTEHMGLPPYNFGILFSINGAMVVMLQIPIRKGAMRLGSTKAFVIAQLLYAIGFTYFLVSRDFTQFLTGVVVLTLGEIIFMPAISGFIANLSPVDMRGRYSALAGLFYGIGGSVGTMIGFRLYDILPNKEFIWAVLGAVGFATIPGYIYLLKAHRKTQNATQ